MCLFMLGGTWFLPYNYLLTGGPGAGKTTVVIEVSQRLEKLGYIGGGVILP
ncbi:MAG: Nucleoside-triphosphatase THEP1 [Candidatus Methanohalarchaeum thermophilum]|uniref:Nucleoside-triphosphatase THEP1 n=1 Tax=Methanohalarchaeum thermophilum TaxID=1903181 RepID=A0A1Q6DT01_METT1|nr:MAG: Nucleoside-triphosphatase THEP1 [Candidatus Methanohalarchaeum thermophilum]